MSEEIITSTEEEVTAPVVEATEVMEETASPVADEVEVTEEVTATPEVEVVA